MRSVLFHDLVEAIHDLPYGTGIYTEMGRWREHPLTTPLYLTGREEEDSEDFDDQMEAKGLQEFFRLSTFQDIADVERRKRPNGTIEDLVAAAKHYRHYDDFRP
jgi:hypothetical protein